MNPGNPQTNTILGLLRLAQTQQRYAAELAKATGENFNIFNILRVGHLEVTTHSPMLAQLLNPKSVHGQGSTFLQKFLDQFGIQDFDAATASVKMEHHIGAVTENAGGRIDILLQDGKGGVILIENKIYAGDQPNQMKRNRNYKPKAHLFYLTLEGREPYDAKEVANIRCISYETEILAWLKDCRKEAACVHTVRETISQYIHLLQELTQQNASTRMNQELTNAVLDNKDSYQAYVALCNAQKEVRKIILNSLNDRLRVMATIMNLELAEPLHGDGRRYDAWFFSSKELAAKNLKIGFQFDGKDYQNSYFGFCRTNDDCDVAGMGPLQACFQAEFSIIPPTKAWPAHVWWDDHRSWTNATFESIRFGSFVEELKTLVERLLRVFQSACKDQLFPITA